MTLCRIGLGTYLGSPDDATDAAYLAAAGAYLEAGGNVFDTAANYRCGRSERVLGRLFRARPHPGVFVSTKAGYLPMGDGLAAESPRAWFQRVLAGPGVVGPEDLVDGCHCLTPRYLDHQLGVSLAALGLDRVDLLHLHNPEHQLPAQGRRGFRQVLRRAFEACEGFAREGRIGAYGVATWTGLRVPPGSQDHLSLEELVATAREIAGEAHHFRWVQLPLNLGMPQAFDLPTQEVGGRRLPALEAAQALGLSVQVSASLMQARLLEALARHPGPLLPGCASPAQAALQFAASCPGVATALVGMANPAHVAENLAVLGLARASLTELRALVG